MQRICCVLQIKPERLDEYKERHRAGRPLHSARRCAADRAMRPLEEVFHL